MVFPRLVFVEAKEGPQGERPLRFCYGQVIYLPTTGRRSLSLSLKTQALPTAASQLPTDGFHLRTAIISLLEKHFFTEVVSSGPF